MGKIKTMMLLVFLAMMFLAFLTLMLVVYLAMMLLTSLTMMFLVFLDRKRWWMSGFLKRALRDGAYISDVLGCGRNIQME